MKRRNSPLNNFSQKTTTRKGFIGEQIVDAHLIRKGLIPYRPELDVAHPFDRLAASLDKKTIFICEAKAKAARTYFPDTGIDVRLWIGYRYMRFSYNLDTYLVFIDEIAGTIYGNFLSLLDQSKRLINGPKKGLWYPRTENTGFAEIRYFPIERMETIGILEAREVSALKNLSTRNPAYDPDPEPDLFK